MGLLRSSFKAVSNVDYGNFNVHDAGHITIQCTGVAVRAESEINIVGHNPVIVVGGIQMQEQLCRIRVDDSLMIF